MGIDEGREEDICFNTFINYFQRASGKSSIRIFSIVYYNDKYNSPYSLPKVLWTLFKTSIFKNLECVYAGGHCSMSSTDQGLYEGPSENENTLILNNLESLEHIHLEYIGLSRELTENSLLPIMKYCKRTLKTIYLNSAQLEGAIRSPPMTFQLFHDFVFVYTLDSPSIEMIRLDIGPIPLYPIEQALDAFKFICDAAGDLLSLKKLKSLSLHLTSPDDQIEQAFNMIQKRVCFTNRFLAQLEISKTLRYLRLDPYFLLNCKRDILFLLLAKNPYLKILNIAFNGSILSHELVKQLTEGLKQNVGLETLQVSLCYNYGNDSKLFQNTVDQLLHSLHHHPEMKTFILDGPITIKPLSRLLFYNSKLTIIDIKRFTLDEVKAMVPCLVFNGRRTEFDCFSHDFGHEADQEMETFQGEVDTFKDTVFSSMLKVMSYIIDTEMSSKNSATCFGSHLLLKLIPKLSIGKTIHQQCMYNYSLLLFLCSESELIVLCPCLSIYLLLHFSNVFHCCVVGS